MAKLHFRQNVDVHLGWKFEGRVIVSDRPSRVLFSHYVTGLASVTLSIFAGSPSNWPGENRTQK